MNDDKILDKIKRSADDIEIPDRLKPENIRDLIKNNSSDATNAPNSEAGTTPEFSVIENGSATPQLDGLQILPKDNSQKTPFSWRRFAGLAAAVALFFVAVPVGIVTLRSVTSNLGNKNASEEEIATADTSEPIDLAGAETGESESFETASAAGSQSVEEAFGGYFYTADSLDDIRNVISTPSSGGISINGFSRDGFAKEGSMASGSVEESADTGATSDAKTSDIGGTVDFSSTNLREMDVDEGDIVKTDGKYIYIYKEFGGVKIIDITGSKMNIVSEFDPDFAAADDSHLVDLFIREDTLVLLAETYSVDFESNYETDTEDSYVITDGKSTDDNTRYMLGDSTHTVALTYDISDRSNPKKLGELDAEGSYQSSRISDGYLYLFTWYHGNDIPMVAKTYPATGCIYIPREKDVRATFTMTSMKLTAPSASVDTKVIYSAGSDVYVTSDSIILEVMEYDTRERTNLFRFSYKDGQFSPVGVGAVPGYIESSFSIDEDSQGRIRVATTAYGFSSQSSGVYVFDPTMKRIGKLTGLAKGEDIKSARFLEDTLYLVTYENKDPLFSIDLSDPTKPQVIGKLKLPGFSDYLHFWSDDLLLGIGYDTDEKTGEQLGAKLSMFDISNPKDVKEVSTINIKDIGYLPGMSNYKALLVNPSKKLIGFGTTTWLESKYWQEENQYMVYTYDNNTFKKLAAEKTTGNDNASMTRGLFVGDTFYITDEGRIRSYNMKDNFKEIEKLNL